MMALDAGVVRSNEIRISPATPFAMANAAVRSNEIRILHQLCPATVEAEAALAGHPTRRLALPSPRRAPAALLLLLTNQTLKEEGRAKGKGSPSLSSCLCGPAPIGSVRPAVSGGGALLARSPPQDAAAAAQRDRSTSTIKDDSVPVGHASALPRTLHARRPTMHSGKERKGKAVITCLIIGGFVLVAMKSVVEHVI